MPCPHCKHCLAAERSTRRCKAIVPAQSYRAEGQCQKPGNKATGLCGHHEKHPPRKAK